jgi:hypothetical protein
MSGIGIAPRAYAGAPTTRGRGVTRSASLYSACVVVLRSTRGSYAGADFPVDNLSAKSPHETLD